MNKENNKSEVWKTILATVFGIALVASSWYYVEDYNKDKTEAEKITKEEGEQTVYEEDFLLQEELLIELEESLTNNDMVALVDCLKESNVVIYGNKSCPACASLAESFGGYNAIDGLYVECTEERERCTDEKETNYVPEIQIKGDVYSGGRAPSQLAAAVECSF